MRVAPRAEERVRREFFPEDYEAAMQILSGWQTKVCAQGEGPSRLHAAVLNLAHGSLPNLKSAIASAKSDFRDVLLCGEYREYKRLWCIVCEPSKSAPDPLEEAFLQSIRANPRDNAPRLIYADWLEERGDLRAVYLRLLCEWLACLPAEGHHLIDREREVRVPLDRRWLARIRGMPVRDKTKKV